MISCIMYSKEVSTLAISPGFTASPALFVFMGTLRPLVALVLQSARRRLQLL